jgi:arylsulfatase A-like enzyme
MYWAPGASHGPHQVMKEWADKYKGKFDDGWDKYRERVFARAKAKGWIPQNAQLTPRPASMASWDSIPEDEKPFQRRLMEVFAGFTEHADYNAGRVIDEIERQGKLDNTLIFYIWGDNGSSAEGLYGTISEQLAQNGIPTKISQHLEALKELGGLDALGRPKTDNMYHAAWAWAGSTPYKGTKLMGAYFGGTRQPMAVSWPKRIKARPDAAGAVPPRHRHRADDLRADEDHAAARGQRLRAGLDRRRQHGLHVRDDPKAPGPRKTQFFDIMASRGIYHDGWFASAPGRANRGWAGMPEGVKEWSPLTDKWELYNLDEDWSQANDLAAANPQEARADEGCSSCSNPRRTRTCPSAAAVVHRAVSPRGRARLPAHRVDLRWTHHPNAGIRRAQARKGGQPRDHGRGRARERERRALRAGWASPAASPAT